MEPARRAPCRALLRRFGACARASLRRILDRHVFRTSLLGRAALARGCVAGSAVASCDRGRPRVPHAARRDRAGYSVAGIVTEMERPCSGRGDGAAPLSRAYQGPPAMFGPQDSIGIAPSVQAPRLRVSWVCSSSLVSARCCNRYEPGMWKVWTAIAGFSIALLLAVIEARRGGAAKAWRRRLRRAKLKNRKSRLRQVSRWFVAVRILANWTGG